MGLKNEHKAMLASYGRSVLGATLALYMSGITDPKELWAALVAALAPVLIRAINPNDKAFGRMPAAKAVEEALAEVKEVIAKQAAKKPASAKKVVKKTAKKK